jgi:restriction system protein
MSTSKYCPKCGEQTNPGVRFCPNCGADIDAFAKQSGAPAAPGQVIPQEKAISPHNRTVALLLLIFLGYIGAHQFYVGNFFWGIVYLFTGGIFGIGLFFDFIGIVFGGFKDAEGRLVENW